MHAWTVGAWANQFASADKTWCIWKRSIGHIQPGEVLNDELRREVLSTASGDRELKMLKRSRTSPQMARDLTNFCRDLAEVRPGADGQNGRSRGRARPGLRPNEVLLALCRRNRDRDLVRRLRSRSKII